MREELSEDLEQGEPAPAWIIPGCACLGLAGLFGICKLLAWCGRLVLERWA